jgi:hypothetical protein
LIEFLKEFGFVLHHDGILAHFVLVVQLGLATLLFSAFHLWGWLKKKKREKERGRSEQ